MPNHEAPLSRSGTSTFMVRYNKGMWSYLYLEQWFSNYSVTVAAMVASREPFTDKWNQKL
jgi:hypothetical protein